MSLQFNAATHTYAWAGQVVPSVTQILRPLYDFSSVPPGVLAAKAELGTMVHAACELHDQGRLDESSIDEDCLPYVEAYRAWRHASGAVILLNEQQVYHGMHRYAGTLDRVVSIDDEEWVIDLKTSASIHRGTGPQTAAYEQALNFGRPLRRGALQLRPDGSYRLHEFTSPRDWVLFQACLLIHRFNQENEHV